MATPLGFVILERTTPPSELRYPALRSRAVTMDVEREYRVRVDAMSVVERVRRAEALFRWSRAYLVRAILDARGTLSERELARELALRQYGSDPDARPWIEAWAIDAGR